MLDSKFVIQNLPLVEQGLKNRGVSLDILTPVKALVQNKNELQQEHDRLRNEQTQASQEIQKMKKAGQDASATLGAMKKVSDRLKEIAPLLESFEEELSQTLLQIPNLPHASVPVGQTENDNQVVRTWGTQPQFSFSPK